MSRNWPVPDKARAQQGTPTSTVIALLRKAAMTSQDSGHSALAPHVSPGDTSSGIPRFLANLASSTQPQVCTFCEACSEGLGFSSWPLGGILKT